MEEPKLHKLTNFEYDDVCADEYAEKITKKEYDELNSKWTTRAYASVLLIFIMPIVLTLLMQDVIGLFIGLGVGAIMSGMTIYISYDEQLKAAKRVRNEDKPDIAAQHYKNLSEIKSGSKYLLGGFIASSHFAKDAFKDTIDPDRWHKV